ncbi:MAG: nucleotidyl transferase AbiEii/AbiGii toxin family protein [Verrucomicrobiales bacterium]
MNDLLESMLARYSPSTLADYENALREIVQELALLGLWRSKFYEHAAFYGGTALRVFHGLPRFSEDVDFR